MAMANSMENSSSMQRTTRNRSAESSGACMLVIVGIARPLGVVTVTFFVGLQLAVLPGAWPFAVRKIVAAMCPTVKRPRLAYSTHGTNAASWILGAVRQGLVISSRGRKAVCSRGVFTSCSIVRVTAVVAITVVIARLATERRAQPMT